MNLPALPALPPPTGHPVDEALRAAAVALVLALVFALAEWWRHRASPPVEWTRKSIHSAAGLVTMTFPWLFAHTGTLVALGAVCGAVLLAARKAGKLRSLFGIERGSWGELFFPLAILLLFAVGRDRPLFYVISIAALVVCDALAAVLGRAYGRHAYRVTTDQKSLEGSMVFLLSAFLVFHLPLLLASDLDRLGCVLIAAQLALLVASFEAISGRGSDNLIVPLATYYLLVKLTANTTAGIAFQLAVQLAILALALLIARRTRFLSLSGAVAAHLVLYAAFSLGGPPWIVAPLLALVAFLALDAAHRRSTRAAHRLPRHVTAIFYMAIVATGCLFADNTFSAVGHLVPTLAIGSPFFALFVGALAAPLATAGWWTSSVLQRTRDWPPAARALASGLLAWLVVVPAGIAAVRGRLPAEEAAIAALVVVASLALYAVGSRLFHPERWGRGDLRVLAAAVLLAVLLALPVHLALRTPGLAG
ncbi:MAG: diacylglycerol/polyprenol kinase family protein [Candidatus Eiseniibacteriota bacterium]